MYFARTALLVVALSYGSRTAAGTPTVADLANLQAERILLSAQLEKLKAQAALKALDASGPSTAAGHALPTLRLVYGSHGINVGLFVFPTGSTATAKAGDTLPGQLSVRSVELQGADLVDRNGQTVHIPLSSQAPSETMPAKVGGDDAFTRSSSPIN